MFLWTRVKDQHDNDWKGLWRVTGYIKETIHLPLIVGTLNSCRLVLNINLSFPVYPQCKSCTGASLSQEIRGVMCENQH